MLDKDEPMFLHIDYVPLEDCKNPKVWHTCLKCNKCGRFNKNEPKQKESDD